MSGRTFPIVVRVVALLVGAGILATACGGSSPQPPPPVRVTVDRVAREVVPGTTFGGLIGSLHLRAMSGRLYAVTGEILDRFADPGRILLNGRRAPMATRLKSGDRIAVVDGTDRTEGTRRVTVDVAEPRVGNPERTLDVYRMRQVTVTGRISGDLLSVTDVPRGPGRAPREVALTFDDGPWPHDTMRIVALLKKFHVPATFFMIGNRVQAYPQIAQAVAAAGFPVGDHSWDHPEDPALTALPPEKIISEIADAKTALTDLGITPTLFRPPGGSYDDAVVQEARALGMRVVLWSVDPQDWRSSRTAKEITRSVLARVQPGSIILLHDGGGDAGHTIKALPDIIKRIRKRGLGFTTVPAHPL